MLRQLPLLAQYLEESLRQDELRRIEEAEKAKLRYWGSGCVAAVRFLNLIWKYNELHGTPKMAILNPKIIFLGFHYKIRGCWEGALDLSAISQAEREQQAAREEAKRQEEEAAKAPDCSVSDKRPLKKKAEWIGK